jgi:hypothetical protein
MDKQAIGRVQEGIEMTFQELTLQQVLNSQLPEVAIPEPHIRFSALLSHGIRTPTRNLKRGFTISRLVRDAWDWLFLSDTG